MVNFKVPKAIQDQIFEDDWLDGELGNKLKKIQLGITLNLVGYRYAGQEIEPYKTSRKILSDIESLIAERSHGLVSVRVSGDTNVRDCKLFQALRR